MMDVFSKFTNAVATRDQKAITMARAFVANLFYTLEPRSAYTPTREEVCSDHRMYVEFIKWKKATLWCGNLVPPLGEGAEAGRQTTTTASCQHTSLTFSYANSHDHRSWSLEKTSNGCFNVIESRSPFGIFTKLSHGGLSDWTGIQNIILYKFHSENAPEILMIKKDLFSEKVSSACKRVLTGSDMEPGLFVCYSHTLADTSNFLQTWNLEYKAWLSSHSLLSSTRN